MPVIHFIAFLDVVSLATAQPHLRQEISFYASQPTNFTVQGTLTALTHTYRHLRQLHDSATLTRIHAITISFRGIQGGNAQHQRALIRSFVDILPNLRHLQVHIPFSLQSGLGLQFAALISTRRRSAAFGLARRYVEGLDLDDTILREDIVVSVQLFFAMLGGGAIMFSNTHVVQRPIDRLWG